MSANNLLKNIFLQAKRTSKILDVPLTKSKDIVAWSIYQCHDYDDLCHKLQNNSLKASVYPYCKLHPNSDPESQKYIERNIGIITARLAQLSAAPVNPIPLIDLIWKIFGFKSRTCLAQAYPHIEVDDNWFPYEMVNGDLDTVVYYDCKINNVAFKIFATRIVTPYLFSDNSQNELSKLRDEFEKYTYPPLMWTNWNSWQKEADVYLNAISLKKGQFKSSFDKVAAPKSIKQRLFQDTLYAAIKAISDEFVGTSVCYSDISGSEFCLIGFPMFGEPESEHFSEFYLTASHIQNGKCIFQFENNILCLDVFEVNQDDDYIGDAEDYYNALTLSLQQFEYAVNQFIVIDGKRYKACLRPCTHAEFSLYRNSPIVF